MTQYDFTADWFSSKIPPWQEILSELKPSKLLEVGCFEGRSACFLIDTCGAERSIEIDCIDTWLGGAEHRRSIFETGAVEDRFDRNIARAKQAAKYDVVVLKSKQDSLTALATLVIDPLSCGSYDFVYIDGSHIASDVLTDAVLAFRLLREGGIMIFDDYTWRLGKENDILAVPKLAIDAFTTIFGRNLQILHDYPVEQFYLRKLGAPASSAAFAPNQPRPTVSN